MPDLDGSQLQRVGFAENPLSVDLRPHHMRNNINHTPPALSHVNTHDYEDVALARTWECNKLARLLSVDANPGCCGPRTFSSIIWHRS